MPRGDEAKLEGELDGLYGLPLREFTAAREELAKRLRAEGQRELADQVKSLRKPSVGAWLANQLVRERQLDVQRLVNAGESLAEAQTEAAGGASAEAFADARRQEQRALERLAQAAREIAEREGLSPSAVERATQTLRAASLTEEGRDLLKRGRLSEDLQPPGFEALVADASSGRSRSRRRSTPQHARERDERRQAATEARQRVRQLRAKERELTKTADAAERQAGQAERQASEQRAEADRARAEAAKAAEAVADAERELEQLQAPR
jgi:hypothetical protein